MKRKTSAARGPSQRQLRVGELVRHALSEIFTRGEVHDAELDGLTLTVPEVQVSPDLRHATAFVMPLGGVGVERTMVALERHRRFLRGEVARRVKLRYAPEIAFRADTSFSEAEKVDQLLRSPDVQRSLDRDEQ